MLLLLPPDFSASLSFFLIATAGVTSFITAALGAGGGIVLLGVMAQVLPPTLIVPLHGIVQLGSNASRATLNWRHIDWPLLKPFSAGSLLGAAVGSWLLISLDPAVMYLTIAAFILFLCWGPSLPKGALTPSGIFAASSATGFITLFVGATGPLVGAFIKQMYTQRHVTIATFAAAMTFQHIVKVGVFSYAGVEIIQWLPLLCAMIASGTLGTWLGLKLLSYIPDYQFSRVFDIILTLLAFRLIWQALSLW